MLKRFFLASVVLSLCLGGVIDVAYSGHRFGGGLHYLRTVGDIKDDPEWDANAVGIIGSYQYAPGLLKLEFDLEWVPNYGGSESLIEPQAYLLIGGLIYGAGGIGIGYIDGGWQSNPFYALRLGGNLKLGSVGLDIFASYRFQSSKDLEGFDSSDFDAITFGAIVRFGK
jgi:hypothetical protein